VWALAVLWTGSSYAGINRIKFSGSMASTTSQPGA
jgi:hypothetical protein